MSVVLILLAASLSIAACFLIAFIWSVKSGQYEDDYTPSVRMLFENELREKAQPIDDNRKPGTNNPKPEIKK